MAKILIGVSSSYCANFLKGQVKFLGDNGYEVVLLSGPGEEIGILAKKENARLYTINFTKRISPIRDLAVLFQIIKILRKEKPDIVNAGNPKSGFLIMLACWLIRFKKRIFVLHGLLSETQKGLSRILITQAERISCSIAQEVIVVSPSLMLHARSRKILKPNKGIVIEKGSYNGIDIDYFKKSDEVLSNAKKLATELHLTGNEIILGFVGRVSKDKGVELLLAAFNQLVKKYPQLRMLIAGPLENEDPISKKALHQLYEDERVFYLGKLLDIVPVYTLMNFLVLCSFREGLPNVLMEAAAMDIAVIAPDIPGCRDSLKPGWNGLLFEVGDIPSLKDTIEKLITNENLRNTLGSHGRSFVQENFSQEKIWNGQLEIYKRISQL